MHLVLICPPFPSHITVFETLGIALRERGHQVSLLLNEGAGRHTSGRLPVYTVPQGNAPQVETVIARAANPGSLLGILRTVRDTLALTESLCRGGMEILRRIGADAVVGDQMEPASGLLARALDLPFVSIACALPLERDERIPPPYLDWPYASDEAGLRRNRGGEMVSKLLLTRQRRGIAQLGRELGLGEPLETIEDCLSPRGTVAQIPFVLDLPRRPGKRPLLGVGPIRAAEFLADLALDIDPERPFVFMSLGTLQGHRFRLFQAVAKSCRKIGAQLLVAHCGGLDAAQAERVGATWVRDFVPQRAVLARADLCVTHGGQNTVLDALEAGVPLLVLPIAFDQPGIAARVEHHAVGLKLSPRFLSAAKVEGALVNLLHDRGYRDRAAAMGSELRRAGGLAAALDAVETLLEAPAPGA